MSIFASLVRAYDRLPDAPPYGFSQERIGFCIVLTPSGSVAEVIDLRDSSQKKLPRQMLVPQAVKRSSGVVPNFLWDKSSYVLGVTNLAGLDPDPLDDPDVAADKSAERNKRVLRASQCHAAFRQSHAEWLAGSGDEGLEAVLRFLDRWTPADFVAPVWSEEMEDQNFVFALAEEYRDGFLHDRPAGRDLWQRIGALAASHPQTCLITGASAPVSRLHPSIKGVWEAQPSGASLVSFNQDSFTSYGHVQGDNAPISEAVAFAYTTTLNRFLERDSGHRTQIGDASTVFWADSDPASAAAAENCFAGFLDPAAAVSDDDKAQTRILASQLERIRQGHRLSEVAPDLAQGVRFHVLGLAPNASRLSARFYWEDDFGTLTANYQRYLADTKIDPPPNNGWPALWQYMSELAVQGKRENIPPRIAGDWMTAILTGRPYPLTLLSLVTTRIRADGEINARRVAILKSVLIRNLKMEAPVALDISETNRGYVLGRLFAAYEEVQRAAQGRVNASIKDKFYGSASATPQKVFRLLDAGSANHFGKLRKLSPGRAVNLEKLIASIAELMDPSRDPIPPSLNAAEQAMFGIGYYHQRSEFFRKTENTETVLTETEQ